MAFTCTECQESFNHKEDWEDHILAEHPTSGYRLLYIHVCPYCNSRFRVKDSVKFHPCPAFREPNEVFSNPDQEFWELTRRLKQAVAGSMIATEPKEGRGRATTDESSGESPNENKEPK